MSPNRGIKLGITGVSREIKFYLECCKLLYIILNFNIVRVPLYLDTVRECKFK